MSRFIYQFCSIVAALLLLTFSCTSTNAETTISLQKDIQTDKLAERSGTLLVSTIDGYLTAIDAETGVDKWRFKEGPLLESPVNVQRGFTFIPDPRDGQLYLVVEGRLSKLPFTIPHLVRVSPCKSSDGVFYAGSKKDVWISVNPDTGERMDAFASNPAAFCPASHAQAVHIGKTEYHIQMVDTKQRDRHWNATFVDYSSHLLPEDTDYPLRHFTSSADGRVLTVDARSGLVLWQRDFSNVIVNMYLLKGDGMHRLPSTAIGQETFELLAQSVALNPQLYAPAQLPDRLFHTLYVGESPRVGLYALPAYVDERTNRIAPKYLGPPLLEGPTQAQKEGLSSPDNLNFQQPKRQALPPNTVGTIYTTQDGSEFLILGYHEVPKGIHGGSELLPTGAADGPSKVPLIAFNQQQQGVVERQPGALSQSTKNNNADRILPPGHQLATEPEGFMVDMFYFAHRHPYEASAVVILFVALLVVSAWLFGKQRGLTLTRSRTWSADSAPTGSFPGSEHGAAADVSRSSRGSVYTAYEPEELPLGWHRVNNSSLSYNSGEQLGRGCEGTIVYVGKFDDRKVAVKRIVSASLNPGMRQQIQREVLHLRQSDSHANVIRYFCSESDRHFHYIALELCDMSLEDFVRQQKATADADGGPQLSRKTKLQLMEQTASGIAHLHHINIVHRDVKPKNILLVGLKEGRICVKISDFGLCKTVKLGHNSISKVSGVVGTEGWMAPELFSADASVTYAVDVFSLGCVFYFVLTDGQHPFGEALSRMSNIKFGFFSLELLDENAEHTSRTLIEAMIRADAKQRPAASAVAAHPLFWEPAKQLQFLTEVSDWIEKKDNKDPIMRRLEWRRQKVIGNWLEQVDELLRQDLSKQRNYLNNIRDLLRAVRNKKHHYQELSPELRLLLGPIPDHYLEYFTSRFPKLFMHVFMGMACLGHESIFQCYFTPKELRDFYDQERATLYRLEPERRSASPLNWRKGSPTNTTTNTSTIQSTLAVTEKPVDPNVSIPPFDPTKPPPPIPAIAVLQLQPPMSRLSPEIPQEAKSHPTIPTTTTTTSTTVVEITTKLKSPKPKSRNNKRKKKPTTSKAPFSVLMAGTLEEEEEKEQNEEENEENGERPTSSNYQKMAEIQEETVEEHESGEEEEIS